MTSVLCWLVWLYALPAVVLPPLSWLVLRIGLWNYRYAYDRMDEKFAKEALAIHRQTLRYFWWPVMNIVNVLLALVDLFIGLFATLAMVIFD